MAQVLAQSSDDNSRTRDVITVESVTFESLFLSENVLKGLTETGFKKPSPIQLKAIPIGRCGFDLIVKSKSGTGKTVVFSVIALENIITKKKGLQVLIVAPTREIAVQIQEVIGFIGCHIEGLKVESFIGGLPLQDDKEKCKNCHIAVGTPGRLKHLIKEGVMITKSVHLFVLDEVDKLMESSFQNDINEIYNSTPPKKQIITTSATYSKELAEFLEEYMCSPTHVTAELETPLLLGLKQFAVVVDSHTNVVQQMRVKTEQLVKIFSSISFTQCIVFSNYQSRAESISNLLNQKGWHSTYISAAQTQNERLLAVNSLKKFECRILLSTDLMSRGIDAANVDLVINYDVPLEATTYLHRMGRAGRYGSFGACINLVSGVAELSILQGILGQIGGSTLSIPKLPTFSGNVSDLLKADLSSEEHIVARTDNINNSNSELWSKSRVYDLTKRNGKSKSGKRSKSGSGKTASKKETSSEAESADNSQILSILNDNKNEVEEVQKQISNMDAQSILESLASQQFEMEERTGCGSTWQPPPGVDAAPETAVASDRAAINNILHTLLNQKNIETAGESHSRPANEDGRKDSCMDSDDQKRKAVFTKNMALLNVSKILDGKDEAGFISEESPISEYLDMLKKQEKEKVSELSKLSLNDILGTLQDVEKLPQCTTPSLPLEDAPFKMEDVFKLGYDCIVKSDNDSWKTLLDSVAAEVDTQEQTEENEGIDTDGEIEAMSTEEKEIEVMKWVPVEATSKSREAGYTCTSQTVERDYENYSHLSAYFNECSEQLWQNGLNFDNVASFDDWFHYEWEAQLYSIRNFVQQNIYVSEMSRYQNTMAGKK
nr:probable ATP-dependent RNA helicase DDX20 [Leptinotarsa decemlineata]